MSDQIKLSRGQQMALALIQLEIDAPAVSISSWMGMAVQALARREVEAQAVSRQVCFHTNGPARLYSLLAIVVEGQAINPVDGSIGWGVMAEQLASDLDLDQYSFELGDVLDPIEILDYDMADDEALEKYIGPAFETLLDYFEIEQMSSPAQNNASRRAGLRL